MQGLGLIVGTAAILCALTGIVGTVLAARHGGEDLVGTFATFVLWFGPPGMVIALLAVGVNRATWNRFTWETARLLDLLGRRTPSFEALDCPIRVDGVGRGARLQCARADILLVGGSLLVLPYHRLGSFHYSLWPIQVTLEGAQPPTTPHTLRHTLAQPPTLDGGSLVLYLEPEQAYVTSRILTIQGDSASPLVERLRDIRGAAAP